MLTQAPTQFRSRGLIDEVLRYLAAVEAFRAEGHEPRWLPEHGNAEAEAVPSRRPVLHLPPIP